jgi:hypothetical protein
MCRNSGLPLSGRNCSNPETILRIWLRQRYTLLINYFSAFITILDDMIVPSALNRQKMGATSRTHSKFIMNSH